MRRLTSRTKGCGKKMNELIVREAIDKYIGEIPIDFDDDCPGWSDIYCSIAYTLDFPPTTSLMEIVNSDADFHWSRHRLEVYDVIAEYENEFISDVTVFIYDSMHGEGSYEEDMENDPYFWESEIEEINNHLYMSGEGYDLFWTWMYKTWDRKRLFYFNLNRNAGNHSNFRLDDWRYNEREHKFTPIENVW